MVLARIMLCSSFLFTCSGPFGYHFGGLNEVSIGVMECCDCDRTGVHRVLDDADDDIGRKVQPESARPRPRSALPVQLEPSMRPNNERTRFGLQPYTSFLS